MPTSTEGRIDLIDPALESPAFRATNARGRSILLGSTPADPSQAEQWSGVSPMEVVLLGLGGCTGIDVISTLRKARQHVTSYAIHVNGERRDDHPRIYTQITVEHELHGTDLRESAVRRAIQLSAKTYCSVSAILAATAQIHLTYRIVNTTTHSQTTGTIPHGAQG